MFMARAPYKGGVKVFEVRCSQPRRWRYRLGVVVIEHDRKTAIAAAKFLATTRPQRRDTGFNDGDYDDRCKY